MARLRSKRVFILGGGASLGAHQVGALKCLAEQGVKPDAIVGSSIGVLNACLYASGGIELLESVWTEIRTLGLLRPSLRHNPITGLSFFSVEPFAKAIEPHIDFAAVRKSALDLSFILLNLSRGRGEFFSNHHVAGDEEMQKLVRAGYALPGVFPPVHFRGDWYADGGLAWNVPLLQAVEMGATEIWVLALITTALPYKESFTGMTDYFGRLLDVLWTVLGNAGYSTTRIEPDGTYRGVPVTVIQPSEAYSGLDLMRLLSSSPERSRRLITNGYTDAKRELARLERLRERDQREAPKLEAPEPAFRNEVA